MYRNMSIHMYTWMSYIQQSLEYNDIGILGLCILLETSWKGTRCLHDVVVAVTERDDAMIQPSNLALLHWRRQTHVAEFHMFIRCKWVFTVLTNPLKKDFVGRVCKIGPNFVGGISKNGHGYSQPCSGNKVCREKIFLRKTFLGNT